MPEIRDLLQELDGLVLGNFFTVRSDALANSLGKLATMADATVDLHDQQLIGGLQAVAADGAEGVGWHGDSPGVGGSEPQDAEVEKALYRGL